MNIYFESLKWLAQKVLDSGDLSNMLLINGGLDPMLKKIDFVVQRDVIEYSKIKKSGFVVEPELPDKQFNNIVIFADKYKQLNLYYLAKAVELANEKIIIIAQNSLGGKSLVKNALDLIGNGDKYSKNHCAIFVGKKDSGFDSELFEQFKSYGLAKKVDGYATTAGVFSHKEADKGSTLLVNMTDRLYGVGADLGSGWGYLSNEFLIKFDDIERLDLYESDYLSHQLSQKNIASRARFFWQDATDIDLINHYDFVVTNPPFHSGSKQDYDLGVLFIKSAHKILKNGGVLMLVANIHLPYEKELNKLFKSLDLIVEKDGFKIFRAVK